MNKYEIYLILDNIRSRENVGSIFRTADGVGVLKIYLCGITPTPRVKNSKFEIQNPKQIQNSKLETFNSDKIYKTALGAENYVPWEHYKDTWRLLKKLKVQGLKLVALEQTKNSINIYKFKALDFKPLALIVGNEVKGISPKILKYCDKKISIPMYGKKESLNVSVAAGVALYKIIEKISDLRHLGS